MQNKENKVRLTEPKPNRTQTDSSSFITETEVICMITEPNRTHFGVTEASLVWAAGTLSSTICIVSYGTFQGIKCQYVEIAALGAYLSKLFHT